MATATIQTTYTKQVTLVLNEDEATLVRSLVGGVGGPMNKWRRICDDVYRVLSPAPVLQGVPANGCIALGDRLANEV